MSRLLARFVASVLRRRRLATLLLSLLVALAVAGALRIRIDFSSTAFYGDESGAAERLAEFHAAWGADDDTLLVLLHPLDDGDSVGVLGPERMLAIAELGAALGSVEHVQAATSIADVTLPLPALLSSQPRSTGFPELVKQLALAEAPPESRRAMLEQLPFVPALLSADGSHTVIVVELGFSSDDVARTEAVVAELEEVIDDHADTLANVGLAHELAGVPAIRAGFFDLIVRDQALFVPLTLLLIGVALYGVFRRVHGVVIPALAAMVPTAM